MFETRTEIRKAARERYIAKAVERGEKRGKQRTEERMMSILDKHGIEIPPDVKQELFKNHKRRRC